MAEENQVMKEPQQVTKEPQQTVKEPQRVTTKNPKKVEAGKRLAEHNCKRREEWRKEQVKLEKSGVNQYYDIRDVIALGVIDGLGYYIYWSKKGPASREVMMPVSNHQTLRLTSYRWIKSLLYYKNGQEEYSK